MTTSHPQPSWPQLLRVALLGTRQSGELVPAVLGAAEAASNEDREKQVLLAAGALALMRRAGHQPPAAAVAAPTPAPPDPLPPLGPLSAACLQRMVVDELFVELLPNYLHRAAAAGRRVPDSLLAALLRYAARSPDTAAVLGPVAGTRGRWLASLNPEWHGLLAPPTSDDANLERWETGTLAERRAWLLARFGQNADAARALLLAALPTEPAKGQEMLLEILANHLHPDTEPVLETLLRARGQEVRRHAATLLVQLPGAALVERLWARAEGLLQVKRALLGLGKNTLEVTLPATWDKSWLTDGIEEKNDQYAYTIAGHQNAATVGAGAVRLGNILALLPVRRWTSHFHLTPDELLALALDSEWALPLLACWALSTITHQAAEWAAAFVRLWLHQQKQLSEARIQLPLAKLLALVPPAVQQEILLEPLLLRLQRPTIDWDTDWEALEQTQILPGPWPRLLTQAALDVVAHRTAHTAALPFLPREQYRFGYFVSQTLPHVLDPADALWVINFLESIPEAHEFHQVQFQTFIDTLRFQADLEASLTEN
ncbi:DUF5691 domain-containing protein [uncultured Hymenobacter sp.]|uniref:DUF5691 domain-containing protein n=1 Tax=uncultured Hymenobacter sp. TaxID=170016 RepID=UPI0035CB7888